MQLADYSAARIAAKDLKAAGFGGAVRYISPAREPWMGGKPMTRAEVDDFKAHGLEIVAVWQHLKEDWRGGRNAGLANAKAALAKMEELGAPKNAVIYFAIDSNPTLAEWNSTIIHYVKALREVVGAERLGLYCNTKCRAWAEEDGVKHYWWKHNWGSDHTLDNCSIHQYEIDAYKVAGVTVDRNRTYGEFFGQWSHPKAQGATTPAPATGGMLGAIHSIWTRTWRSAVAGSKYEADLPYFIRLIDAAAYRTEAKLRAASEKMAEVEQLLSNEEPEECVCECPCTKCQA